MWLMAIMLDNPVVQYSLWPNTLKFGKKVKIYHKIEII